MTSCCNPHLVLLVTSLVLLLQGRQLIDLLLLMFFSRRNDVVPSSIPPIPPIPPIPRLFDDTWKASDTGDASDTCYFFDTLCDWYRSLVETVENLVFISVTFVFSVIVLLGVEMIVSEQRRGNSHRRSIPPSTEKPTCQKFVAGRNLTRVRNGATPHVSSSSSAISTSQYPRTTGVADLVNATTSRTNNSNHVNLDRQSESMSESRIPHQSFLKSFFVENSGKNGLPGQRDCNLRRWLENRKALGIGPLMEFKVPGSSATVNYVRDDIKVLIRSLVGFLQDKHDQSCCMNGILIDDIFVGEKSINIKNLKLVGFSEEIQKQNYYSLGIIIKIVIYGETKQVPYDMEHFVTLFNNPMQRKNLFKVHVALMSRKRIREFFMFLGDKKNLLKPNLRLKCDKAINEMTDIDDWSSLIDTKSPLYKVYTTRNHYNVKSKFAMIRFFRNAAVHLTDYSNGGQTFQLEDSGLIILASFPKTIADLQERLNHHGILQEFVDENAMD